MTDQTIRDRLRQLSLNIYENRLFRNLLRLMAPINRIFVSLNGVFGRLFRFKKTTASIPALNIRNLCDSLTIIEPYIIENANKLDAKKNRIMSSSEATILQHATALEKSFLEYATNTIIIEGEEVTDESINGIRQAAEYVRENYKFGSWTKQSILDTHSFIMGPKTEDYRECDVYVRTCSGLVHEFPPYQEISILMSGFTQYMNDYVRNIHPVVRATLLKLLFVNIHPFEDGNGRVCRSILCGLLRQEGYPFVTVPYEECMKYYRTLEIYQDTTDWKPFFDYIFYCIDQSLDKYAENLK